MPASTITFFTDCGETWMPIRRNFYKIFASPNPVPFRIRRIVSLTSY